MLFYKCSFDVVSNDKIDYDMVNMSDSNSGDDLSIYIDDNDDVNDASPRFDKKKFRKIIIEAVNSVGKSLLGENAVLISSDFRNEYSVPKAYIAVDGLVNGKNPNDIASIVQREIMTRAKGKRIFSNMCSVKYNLTEITMGVFLDKTNSNYDQPKQLPRRLGLMVFDNGRNYHDYEYIEHGKISINEAIKFCNSKQLSSDLKREIKRILSTTNMNENTVYSGIPVQYVLVAESSKRQLMMKDILLKALITAKRPNGHLVYDETIKAVYDDDEVKINTKNVNNIYSTYAGGTVAVTLANIPDEDTKKSFPDDRTRFCIGSDDIPVDTGLNMILDNMYKYRIDVQTIIATNKAGLSRLVKAAKNKPSPIIMVIREDECTKKAATKWLMSRMKKTKENAATATTDLIKLLFENDDTIIEWDDLFDTYNHWFNMELLNKDDYDYYKKHGKLLCNMLNNEKQQNEESMDNADKQNSTNEAFMELDRMIGLSTVKKVVRQIINVSVANKLYEQYNLKKMLHQPTMHMVFRGNPGTAKTSVARIIARIMKEKGILSKGKLIEVGRQDLVGAFVGHTAIKVHKVFERAMGSVLFIDEAYSLMDDRRGGFGDEAITTIVQEMENRRKDMVVIFAGYPNEMNKMISINPGMKSRIAHYIDFPDYSDKELLAIFNKFIEDRGMKIDEESTDIISSVITSANNTQRESNGRFVRNVMEKVMMRHDERMAMMNPDAIVLDTLLTLTSDDCDITILDNVGRKHRAIGFTA